MNEPVAGTSQEKVDAVDVESRILQLCSESSTGVTNNELQNQLMHINNEQRVTAINRLLSRGQIDLLKLGSGQLVYRLKNPGIAKNIKGADNEEKLVYQIVEEANNKGIWIRDIRYKCNLPLNQVNKILKSLESKKLIKAVKSIAASKRKVYMLYDLEPDRAVTGGSWYCDQDFDLEFVEVLNQQCYKFLQQRLADSENVAFDPVIRKKRACASSYEIWKYICDLKISKVNLSREDVEAILNTLIYDGKVEWTVQAGQDTENINIYRAIKPMVDSAGLVQVPCGVCPLFSKCKEGGIISPSTCQYMKDWLES